MSINKLMPIRDAVFNACEDMGIDVTNQIPTMVRWAVDAEKRIGSYYGWKKMIAVIDIQNCRAKLPCGAMKVQRVLLGDLGCNCTDLMATISNWSLTYTPVFNDSFLVVDLPSNDFTCTAIRWEVQNNHIVFPTNLDQTKCTIQYLGYEEDKDGFIVVNENHVPAIASYIKWMFAERSRFSPIKMDLSDVERSERQWLKNRAIAVADDSELSETERNDIVAMLHDPYLGWGLEVGMN